MSVLIVSYQRPELLQNCLYSLRRQTRPPDEIVIAGVEGDNPTERLVHEFAQTGPDHVVWLSTPEPNVVLQINLALAHAVGDVVCLIDDDAEAFQDWLEGIESHYADPQIGAVGGPDHLHDGEGRLITGRATRIGHITWFGRLWGNHHLSFHRVVHVDVLKGCNMSFRKRLVPAIDKRLALGKRCHHWELDICLHIRKQGKALLYDPAIQVNHYPGPRASVLSPDWVYQANFNMTLVFAKYFSLLRRLTFLLYTFLWGDLPEMGLTVFLKTYLIRLVCYRDIGFIRLLGPSLRGKMDALRALANSRKGIIL
jgi:GT2 family glycosyltransferase